MGCRRKLEEVIPEMVTAPPRADRPVYDLLPEDLRHMITTENSGVRRLIEVTSKILIFPRIRAVVYFRISQVLAKKGLLPIAYAVQGRAIRGAGAEISPLASIGPGLGVWHSVGIVVGGQVVAGRNLALYHGVTLGDGAKPGQPRLGDDVVVGAGAAVLGGINVGDRVIIGANSVVTSDIPDDCIATGAPAVYHPRDHRHSKYIRQK